MHTNFYFLHQLAPALAPHLTGLKFMECFSQDRDEVVLVFAQAKGKTNYYKPFYIKATLRPDFSGLLFPEAVQRARTNSVDLFEAVTGGEEGAGRVVVGVRSFLNERCLAIQLEDDYTLLFKFFGNRPNLLAFQGNTVIELFNSKLVADQQLHIDTLDRPIDQSWEAFERAGYDHRKLFPTFGKEVNAYLKEKEERRKGERGEEEGQLRSDVPSDPVGEEQGQFRSDVPLDLAREREQGQSRSDRTEEGERKWKLIQEVLALLEHPRYYLTRLEHKPTLALVPLGDIQREFDEPIEAANRFYISYNGLSTFEREKADLLRLLEKRLKRAEALIEANLQRLIAREEGATHEEMGHILMANLHDIPEAPGARSPERVELYDFYREQPITIKLKTDLSPQKNAENYYRKAKNEKIEEEHLNQQIANREAEIEQIKQHVAIINNTQSLKELRKYIKQHNLMSDSISEGPAQLFKEVLFENFRILIGRNAKNNDLLTQKYAHKEDLWLHARDVSGSHVIVKYQAGKTFPKSVIERAAELAAWYSKRRTDSLCPVIVTPKKFVRKPKGLAEGQVVVDKEDVVMVVPRGE